MQSTSRRTLALLIAVLIGGPVACARLGLGGTDAAGDEPPAAPRVDVVVEGVEGRLAENVRIHLAIAAEVCDAPQWRVERLLARAPADAERGLRALGHYRPEVTTALERIGDCWQAVVRVDPGPAVEVARVDTRVEGEGRDDPAFSELLGRLPVQVGETLDHARYERAKQAIAGLAAERGYLDGDYLSSRLEVDVARGEAAVVLHYDTGPRYRFGPLEVRQDVLSPRLVDRFIDHEPGADFEASRLAQISRALLDSGYFATADVRPRFDEAEDGAIPIDVGLTARDRHSFEAGVGVTTDTGPRVRFGYENRRINRHGHRARARALFSIVEQELTSDYSIPLADPRAEWLSFQAGLRRKDTDDQRSQAAQLGVRQTKLRGSWLETRSLDFTRDSFTVGRQSGTASLLIPGLSWLRTVADDELRPRRGHRLLFEVSGASDALLSDTSFVRSRAAATWVRGLPWQNGRLIARGELGALWTERFRALPPSQRFFAGGDNSVRGYGFESLAPRDDRGEIVGGRYLATASLEYEHAIRERWAIAGFVDTGGAFDGSFGQGLSTGIGAGIRWQSPVGPVRLDIAHPLDKDDLVRIHLRLGPDL
jgi:translocation and assembly module TamA